jgi:Zn-dependent M28 family amino/carboxypeptidase
VAGERLFAVTLLPGESLRPVPGLRLLDLSPGQALIGLPQDAALDLHELVIGRTREPFHDGVIVVPERRMSPDRGSRHRAAPTTRAPAVPDPRVTAIVGAVVQANLDADVSYYSTTFKTRRSDQPEADTAEADLLARFQALGLAASTHDFDGNSNNVIAELAGALEPQKVVLVGAHYDSINQAGATAKAPGADDNGSGTAAVLELARVFAASGQQFRYTVRFCLFASEEFGLVGSDHYSADLVAAGVEVVAMLNTDMNAYRDPADALDLDMVTNDTTGWLTDDLVLLSQLYVPSLPVVKGQLFGGTSDHKSFYYDGFPAAFYFEDIDHYSPYIHGVNDTHGTSANDFQLAALITQSVAAGLATYAEPIDLTLTHAPLADTEDSWNPYAVRVTTTSHTAATPAACELHWDAGLGESTVPLFAAAAADEWVGEIPAQAAGGKVAYWFLATDSAGNTERLPSSGGFEFGVGRQTVFWSDDFEGAALGWTHGGTQDDWQFGTPAGKSTDPSSAASGVNCWGNDLGGSGFNGEYRANASCWLDTPSISGVGQTGVHLRYSRWLGVEDGFYDDAEIRVNTILQWSNPVGSGTDHLIDDAWTTHDVDVSAVADGNPSFKVRFKMKSDGGLQFGGWTVDDVELYSVTPGVEPELWRDAGVLSLQAGGASNLALNLGAPFAGRNYAVLASISGPSPGFNLGRAHVPLNFDVITQLGIDLLPLLPGFLGTLDAAGRSTATLDLDPGTDPAFAGTILHLAAVMLGPSDHATIPVAIELAQ